MNQHAVVVEELYKMNVHRVHKWWSDDIWIRHLVGVNFQWQFPSEQIHSMWLQIKEYAVSYQVKASN